MFLKWFMVVMSQRTCEILKNKKVNKPFMLSSTVPHLFFPSSLLLTSPADLHLDVGFLESEAVKSKTSLLKTDSAPEKTMLSF